MARFQPANAKVKCLVSAWINNQVTSGEWPTNDKLSEFLRTKVGDANKKVFHCPGKDSLARLRVLAVRERLKSLKTDNALRQKVWLIDCMTPLKNTWFKLNFLLSGGCLLEWSPGGSFTLCKSKRRPRTFDEQHVRSRITRQRNWFVLAATSNCVRQSGNKSPPRTRSTQLLGMWCSFIMRCRWKVSSFLTQKYRGRQGITIKTSEGADNFERTIGS